VWDLVRGPRASSGRSGTADGSMRQARRRPCVRYVHDQAYGSLVRPVGTAGVGRTGHRSRPPAAGRVACRQPHLVVGRDRGAGDSAGDVPGQARGGGLAPGRPGSHPGWHPLRRPRGVEGTTGHRPRVG